MPTDRPPRPLQRANSPGRQAAPVRQFAELQREFARLDQANHRLKKRLNELESGEAVLAIGRKLMAARSEIASLRHTGQRVWYLDVSLYAAHKECERLAHERDAALCCSAGLRKTDQPIGRSPMAPGTLRKNGRCAGRIPPPSKRSGSAVANCGTCRRDATT